jgi:PAT family acetyl-CoA transporter-like MFS transporter 1
LKGDLITSAFSCAIEPEKNRCINGGGVCQVDRDGYYLTNMICVLIGTVTFIMFIKPAATRLQNLPLRAWRLVGNERE